MIHYISLYAPLSPTAVPHYLLVGEIPYHEITNQLIRIQEEF